MASTNNKNSETSSNSGLVESLGWGDFWKLHARQATWFTRNVGYRLGALFALLASRLKLSPNVVSLLSGGITVLSAWIAIEVGQGSLMAGIILMVGLQVGFAFDCADGLLARATGQGSSFGALLDKLIDLTSGMIFPWVLVIGSGELVCGGESVGLHVLIASMVIRAALSLLLWMKDLVMYQADRLKEDVRSKNLVWKLKRAATIYVDDPIYRLVIALCWALDLFWEFMVLYHVGLLLLLLLYVWSCKMDLDGMDRRQRG